ncbi:bifunctional DNA primase/polymerase [Streptomyces sp. NPDC015131]|uniref:bifunctional DNA primase/polymerase n=1 Tax=Streptomyces sp. NPDC015131 TaxID=3364941 RepID=UPI00370090A4
MKLADAARAVAMGLAVFPVNPCGTVCPETGELIDKQPHLLWPGKPYKVKWGEVATRDPNMISAWWTHSPNANIGIACRPSGLLVVDCDKAKDGSDEDGLDQFLDVCARLGLDVADICNTYTVVTGSGGTHLYYRWPEDVQASQAGLAAYGAPLVDIRSNGGQRGGYVLGAGSETTKGRYVLDYDVPFRDCPPELVELCREKPKPKREKSLFSHPGGGSYGGLAEKVMYAPEGNRNNCLLWASRAMCEDGASEEEALNLLGQAAAAAGLTEREAEQTIRSGYRVQQRAMA